MYRACFASSRFKARDTVAPDYTFLALVSSYCCLKIEIHYTHFFIYPCSTPDKISGCMTFGRRDCLPLNVAWPCVQDVLYMGFSNVLKTITSCHFLTWAFFRVFQWLFKMDCCHRFLSGMFEQMLYLPIFGGGFSTATHECLALSSSSHRVSTPSLAKAKPFHRLTLGFTSIPLVWLFLQVLLA